jgi:uncharacterized membrane protein
MSERTVSLMTFAAALGSAVIGGVPLAFSSFVMAALARLPAQQGIAAMQAINLTVINPVFMLLFLGTGALSLGLVAAPFVTRGGAGSALVAIAGLTYLAGCLGVTMAFNVPLNDALAAVPPAAPDAAAFWSRYLKDWTVWNHVRTVAALAAAAGLTLAFRGAYL